MAVAMPETDFGVTYDGPALADGRMRVADLAPALLELGELFREANAILAPQSPPVALEIQATREGSFDVHLILTQAEVAIAALASPGITGLVNLKELLVGELGLFALIKRLKGHPPTRTDSREPGRLTFTTAEGDSITVSSETAELYHRATIRRHASKVVAPLGTEGVDVLRFRRETQTTEVTLELSPADTPSFRVEEREVVVHEARPTMLYSLVAPSFADGNKWRLSDGTQQFWASIEDENFLERVDDGEPFRKGDYLQCEMLIRSIRTEDGSLRTDYTVQRVGQHLPRTSLLAPELFEEEVPTAEEVGSELELPPADADNG